MSSLTCRVFSLLACAFLSLSAACAGALFADVRPASIFTDGAVLQAKRPVPVWGKADPGEKVAVAYGKNKKSAVAGKDAIELAVPEGMTPTRVRYAWAADPDVNLVNSAGLPATPFEISL